MATILTMSRINCKIESAFFITTVHNPMRFPENPLTGFVQPFPQANRQKLGFVAFYAIKPENSLAQP